MDVGVGGTCGNTFSFAWTIIVPHEKSYVVKTFESKSCPVVRRKKDSIEIWSTYQEWAGQGTAFSFFVPELRYYPLESRYPAIYRGELPAALETWPKLQYVSNFCIFVAGISQLNPEIMEAALNRFEEDEFARFDYYKLPTDQAALGSLVEKIRQVREVKEQTRVFHLDWTP